MPRPIGAAVVLAAVVAVIGWGGWALADEATALINTLPRVAQKVREGLEGQSRTRTGSPIDKVQEAAHELEKAADQAAAEAASAAPAASAAGEGVRRARGLANAGTPARADAAR